MLCCLVPLRLDPFIQFVGICSRHDNIHIDLSQSTASVLPTLNEVPRVAGVENINSASGPKRVMPRGANLLGLGSV